MSSKDDALSKKFMKARHSDLEERVSPKRLRHIVGVADTAEKLAKTYGADPHKARLAGLLHDWDKGYDDEGIRARVRELGLEGEIDPMVIEQMPQVLHGPTAARALERDFPQIPPDVIQAIRDHSTASVHATDLDKIIYIADAIEPSRKFDVADELRAMVGKVELDELFFEVYRFWTMALLQRGRVLHPDTMTIWNSLAERRAKRKHAKKKEH